MATGMMIDGEGKTKVTKKMRKGVFSVIRQHSEIALSADVRVFSSCSEAYHLYVSYACPWAHRTLIMRQLKGLDDAISIL